MQSSRFKEGSRTIDKNSYDGHGSDTVRYITKQVAPLRPDIKWTTPDLIFGKT
jgi:hypothetical protein